MELVKPAPDRRHHRRIVANLTGRYMLEDRKEYPCTIIDVSVGGLGLTGPKAGVVGEAVVIYASELGRMLGQISRVFEGGFAVELNMAGIAGQRFEHRLVELETRSLGSRLRFWNR